MDRRRFDHLFIELSLACGQLLPRFQLWLFLRENGAEPDALSRHEALAFCKHGTLTFLAQEGLRLTRWQRYRLRRRVAAFEPAHSLGADLFEEFDTHEDI